MIDEAETKGESAKRPGHAANVGIHEVSQDRRAGVGGWLALVMLMILSVAGVIGFSQTSNAGVPEATIDLGQAITQ